jgi:hypothetical protein
VVWLDYLRSASFSLEGNWVYRECMPRRKRRSTQLQPTAKPQTSDQAPGEETVQVNDQYKGGGQPPAAGPREHAQHQTGG